MYIYQTGLSNDVFLKNTDNYIALQYIEQLNQSCDKFRSTDIPTLRFSKFRLYDETGERAEFQKIYYERRRRLSMFLIRTWLFGEADDIKELEDILWAVCDEYTWALPAHLSGILTDENVVPNRIDLFAAETAHTISEALSLCGKLLHPAVIRRCICEINKRIFEPFESENTEKYALWWENAKSNWSAVCGGAVGMTALYLIEDTMRLKKITDRAVSACNCFLASCTDDGVCNEGISYWMYAMQYYIAFDELLKERTGESVVANEEKIKRICAFPSIACLNDNKSIKFSDYSESLLFFGILCKINERYNVPIPDKSHYKYLMDRCARTSGAVRNIAWFNPELLGSSPITDDIFLPEGQWAILRRENLTAVIKGGTNNEPHNHNDIGSYMLIKGSEIIADELGAAKYTKSYFEPGKRYSFLNAGSQGHSLPVVNGFYQKSGNESATDKFEKTESGICLSFKNAYDKKSCLTGLTRTLSLSSNEAVISDVFEFSSAKNTICERIITKLDATIQNENTVIISKDGKHQAAVTFLTEGTVKILKEAYSVPNSSGKVDEYSDEDAICSATIIEFECVVNADKTQISYVIK